MDIINNDSLIYKYFEEDFEEPSFIIRQDAEKETIKTKRQYVEKKYKNVGTISSVLKNLNIDMTYIGTNKSNTFLRGM